MNVRTIAGEFATVEREISRPTFPRPVVVVWQWGKRTIRGFAPASEADRREIRRAAEEIERTERIRYF